jgi:hypothetical protein
MTFSIKKFGVYIAIAVIAVMSTYAATNLFAQDDAFTGTQYQYRELTFNEPITFMTNVSDGYLVNGRQMVTPSDPEATAQQVFRSMGNNGWELASSSEDRIFIFVRPQQ